MSMMMTLASPSVAIAAVGSGWTEAPYTRCDDCRLVFGHDDLTYNHGGDVYLCVSCSQTDL